MYLGEDFARCHGVAALLEAENADGVVDGVVLRLSSRTKAKSCHPDVDRAERAHVSRRRRDDLAHDGRRGERGLSWVATLRGDPALVHCECSAVLDRRCGTGASL